MYPERNTMLQFTEININPEEIKTGKEEEPISENEKIVINGLQNFYNIQNTEKKHTIIGNNIIT